MAARGPEYGKKLVDEANALKEHIKDLTKQEEQAFRKEMEQRAEERSDAIEVARKLLDELAKKLLNG